MDARHFKAPYLRRTDIWKEADGLRQRLLTQATLPVPVLDLAEFDLGLELVPKTNLRRADDIDALLPGDLKTIVDLDAFVDPRAENRLRFSVAHKNRPSLFARRHPRLAMEAASKYAKQ
jgi:hypothetical protein